MKPEVAFFSGAVLGVAGAYLITNKSESCDNLKGGNLYEDILNAGNTIDKLQKFCDNNQKKYSIVDGVLFNKKQTILYKYPSDKTNESYTIPDSVRNLYKYSFSDGTENLKTIYAPASLIANLMSKKQNMDNYINSEMYYTKFIGYTKHQKTYELYADPKKNKLLLKLIK